MVTWENYEEYIMMHIDGELQPAETQALMAFINKHPELKNELAAYEATRLSPDIEEVYENKETLLKQQGRAISFPQWGRYSIAACIAALVCFSFFKYKGKDNVVNEAVAANITTPILPTPQNNVAAQQNVATAQPQMATVTRKSNKDAIAVQRKQIAPVMKQEMQADKTQTQDVVAIVNTSIDALPVAGMKEMPYNNTIITPAATDEPVYAIADNNNDSKKRTLLDRLPIDNIKKKELGNIAGVISNVYNEVSRAKQDDTRKLSIKVEKKRLVLSF